MGSTQTSLTRLRPDILEPPEFSNLASQPVLVTRDGAVVPAQRRGGAKTYHRRIGAPVEFEHYIAPGTGGHGRARADALLKVIETFECRTAMFGYDATRGDTFLIMTSTRPVLDALELLLPDIAVSMERAAREAASAYAAVLNAAPDQEGAAWRTLVRSYFREHLRGYGRGVAEEIRVLRAEAMEEGGPALAMVLAEDAARIEERFNREFPSAKPLRKEHTDQSRARDDGMSAGRAAGVNDSYLDPRSGIRGAVATARKGRPGMPGRPFTCLWTVGEPARGEQHTPTVLGSVRTPCGQGRRTPPLDAASS